ncbi:BgTH12-01635 [Blumeria graminis f. sp. triticale]|nr:BgTH12-01635 [Blumeria graminis f. sp. triticale]
MSLTRIPLNRVFRDQPRVRNSQIESPGSLESDSAKESTDIPTKKTRSSGKKPLRLAQTTNFGSSETQNNSIRSPDENKIYISSPNSTTSSSSITNSSDSHRKLKPRNRNTLTRPRSLRSIRSKSKDLLSSLTPKNNQRGLRPLSLPNMAARGTRTAKMLEYERQAEERLKEMEIMAEERNRMLEELMKIQKEQDRIAQEEYEMAQYYEAEALKHAEEIRIHREEVRRHQERIRDHEVKLRDHEATSEAFAKVIAMPARQGRDRQVSFQQSVGGRLGGKPNNG